jgi:DNA repair protein RadA/Sms
MAKSSGPRYVCSNCSAGYASWVGRCSNCGEWNTLQQQVDVATISKGTVGNKLNIQSVAKAASTKTPRIATDIAEVDNV